MFAIVLGNFLEVYMKRFSSDKLPRGSYDTHLACYCSFKFKIISDNLILFSSYEKRPKCVQYSIFIRFARFFCISSFCTHQPKLRAWRDMCVCVCVCVYIKYTSLRRGRAAAGNIRTVSSSTLD